MYRENYRAMETVEREMNFINNEKQRIADEVEFKRRLNVWNSKIPIYFINMETIMYSNCLDMFLSKGRKEFKWSKSYCEYSNNLHRLLKENKVVRIPEEIKHLHIDLEIMVSYSQRDLDNVEKPFIDNLFNYLKRDDNCLKSLEKVNILKVDEKWQEGYYFKIQGITEEGFTKSRLSTKYENQIKTH